MFLHLYLFVKISADRPLTACLLDAAESRLFLGSDTGNIAIINLYSLESQREILIQVADEKNEKVPVLNGHCDEITTLSINGDGSLLASGDSAGKYCIWDIISRQCLKVSSMRGPISSLRFVPNWPSITASEHVSIHPVFDLQRNTTKGEKIYIMPHNGNDEDNKLWHDEVDRLIASTLKEMKASEQYKSKGKAKSKKKKKGNTLVGDDDSDIVVLDEDTVDAPQESCPSCSSGVSIPKEAKELIEKQRQEIQKLKRINAELYSFMANEMSEK
ncbi:WD domain, G-beta repeat protein [Oesophagostomum dentatum]|uniref:WD domain, G-beta repeat protein n=1 Tax=Oesophagostomum dentatum TaxID=61180 RepID=A0A0B1S494_OESDE|nr:WD domain, G-beta repeat protein [Oesophagostomum dentatum]